MGVRFRGVGLILGIFLCQTVSLAAHPLRVLVLQSYHKAEWSDSVLAGIHQVLGSVPGTEIAVEYMDTKRMDSKAYLDLLDSSYQMKYAKSGFEAVITVDDAAYRFFLERGTHIWGAIPMAFCGVNRFQDSAWKQSPMVTGVVEKGDFHENLEFATRARPLAQTIWIISDSTRTGKDNQADFSKALEKFPSLQPKILAGISLDSLGRALKAAPKEDFAFFLAFWKDHLGNPVSVDSVGTAFRTSAVPIFGRSEWMMGKGMAGGMCVIGAQQGRVAAHKVLEQLALPTNGRASVITESPNAFLFDYRELIKYQIPPEILPPGSRILYKPSAFLEISHTTFWFGVVVILILLMMVSLLIFNFYRRLHLTRELIKKESDYRLLVETQTDLVVKVDIEGRFLFVSPSYCRYFHTSEDALIGNTFHPRIHPDDLDQTLKAMQALKAPPYKAYMEQRVIIPEGVRWLGWNDSAVMDVNGEMVAIIGVGRDITERKALEMEHESLIEELKRKNFELERYAYTVSHDLRSPLVTIMGFAKEIEIEIAAEQYSEIPDYLKRIQTAGMRMNALLEAILHLSRVGRVTKDPVRFSLKDMFNDVLFALDAPLREAQVELMIEPLGTWPELSGDRDRLTEVFQNLIENAIKYRSTEGKSWIKVSGTRGKSDFQICVEDNGKGIPPDQLKKIFVLFNKIDASTPGIGFGLALCKHVIDGMGGKIWAESEGVGKGARFYVKLRT